MPSLFIVGVLQTLLLFVPIVILLVFCTELFFELTGHLARTIPRYLLATIGLIPLIAVVFLGPLFKTRRRTWAERDRADRRVGIYLVLAVVSLLLIPELAAIEYCAESGQDIVIGGFGAWIGQHSELGFRSWLIWSMAALLLVLIFAIVRFPASALRGLAAILGPLSLMALYLICCLFVVNSPYIRGRDFIRYRNALEDHQATGNTEALQNVVDDVLRAKRFDTSNYRIDFDSIDSSDVHKTELRIYRRADADKPWWHAFTWLHLLTTSYEDELTIRPHPFHDHAALIPELSLMWLRTEWIVYLSALALWFFNYLVANVNRTSLHPFYRDRLSRTFLIAPGWPDTGRGHQSGTAGVHSVDTLRLSELGGENSAAPYHLVNTALNLQGKRDAQLRQRKTIPFVLAKRYSGSDYTGYCETERLEKIDPHMDLGTAMAISAAAAGPTMGAKTVRSLSFVFALLNIRLAYWLPHPGRVEQSSWLDWFVHRNPGVLSLLAEACGVVSDRGRFLNCSDGGHIENLGVYELLRRRCKTIICVDGGADPKFEFFDLTTLQRFASIDLGVEIEIDVEPLIPDENSLSKQQFAIGRIKYHDGQQGTLIYLKLSYSGEESEYLRFYHRKVAAFPHEPTSDQFFDETRFEVYRALGYHIAQRVAADDRVVLPQH